MVDVLGSFPKCVQMRTKHTERTLVYTCGVGSTVRTYFYNLKGWSSNPIYDNFQMDITTTTIDNNIHLAKLIFLKENNKIRFIKFHR